MTGAIHTKLTAADLGRVGRSFLASSADAIIFGDRDGVIRLWSAGAERVFGFSSQEALGQSLRYRVSPVCSHGNLVKVPSTRKDGGRISLEFTIVSVHDDDDRIEGLVALLRDVTSRFEETLELRKEISRLGGSR